MLKRRLTGGAILSLLLATSPERAGAADSEVQELLREVRRLNSRISELESRQGTMEKEARENRIEPSESTIGSAPAKSVVPPTISSSTDELEAMTSDRPGAVQAADGNSLGVGGPYQNRILSNTTVGGYASAEFENFEESDSTFDQHRFIMNIGSQLHPRLKFYSELEYEHGPKLEGEGETSGSVSIEDTNGNGVIDASEAQDVETEGDTAIGRGELAVEQAWIQYDVVPEKFGVRAGALLVPFGKFNLTHDDDLQLFTDRPLVARRVIPSTWTDAGAGFVGQFDVGAESSVFAELYAINGLNNEFEGGSDALREARASLEEDNNNNKAVVGRVAYSPRVGMEAGLSGYHGAYDRDGNDVNAGAFDWDFRFGDFQLLGETALFSLDDGVSKSGARAPKELSGTLAEARYYFWFDGLNNTFLGNGFTDPKFVAAFRYNDAKIERRGDTSLEENSYVVGLAYKPAPSFILKTEYQFNDGELERRDSDGFMASFAIGF